MPPEFLMQQMELREALEDAKDARALDRLAQQLAADKHALEAQIGEAIDERRDYSGAAGLVRKLMFLEKLGSEIDAAYEAVE